MLMSFTPGQRADDHSVTDQGRAGQELMHLAGLLGFPHLSLCVCIPLCLCMCAVMSLQFHNLTVSCFLCKSMPKTESSSATQALQTAKAVDGWIHISENDNLINTSHYSSACDTLLTASTSLFCIYTIDQPCFSRKLCAGLDGFNHIFRTHP